MATLEEKLAELRKALEATGYNAKPTKLRQGSISAVFFDENGNERAGTEEEWDQLYAEAEKTSKSRRR